MKNFNLIYEQYCLNNNLITHEEEKQKEYRSLEQFKHFCDKFDIIVKFVEQSKLSYIVRLFIIKNDKEDIFDFYYKFNPHYYSQHKQIFKAFQNFKQKYIVTVDGTQNTKKVLY